MRNNSGLSPPFSARSLLVPKNKTNLKMFHCLHLLVFHLLEIVYVYNLYDISVTSKFYFTCSILHYKWSTCCCKHFINITCIRVFLQKISHLIVLLHVIFRLIYTTWGFIIMMCTRWHCVLHYLPLKYIKGSPRVQPSSITLSIFVKRTSVVKWIV